MKCCRGGTERQSDLPDVATILEKLVGERVKAVTEGDAGWGEGKFFLEMGKTLAWSQVKGKWGWGAKDWGKSRCS